jgi:hypothetical protein
MSSFTNRLKLKTWVGGDPFLRQDFDDNWDKLDAAPGVFVCDSHSLPSWDSASAGRQIYQTDTRRTLFWTGSAWVEDLVAPSAWVLNHATTHVLGKSTTVSAALGSIVTSRPGTLLINATARMEILTDMQAINAYLTVNGVTASASATNTYNKWDTVNVYQDIRTIPIQGQLAVAAGTHAIAAVFHSGTGNGSTSFNSVCAQVILANTTST